ncbi:hypothetical protein P8452_60092 [Trifolium repens]|nr:hypothetical protein P8452_60092 [Trifolium repens]
MPKRQFGDTLEEGSTSSSSTSCKDYIYDVFISFRGPDTRNNFVDHLHAHLTRKGIFVFKDDKQLQKGESISSELNRAIEDSRVSIVVFSKDYATSTWCLNEMFDIYNRHLESKQIVFPVFYDVDPSDVRKQNGVYENAFVSHTETFKDDPHKVDQWKRAMTCFAGLAGWDVRNKKEVAEIQNIVQAVIGKLGHKFSGHADDLIGIQPQVKTLENLLKLGSDDDKSRVLGIWGMDGIGKTTLATILYDRISHRNQFDACCFIESVSRIYSSGGAIAVQKQILLKTLREKNLDEYSPSEMSGIIRRRLYNMKFLLVLEDVDKYEQLQELHINPQLLSPGSRIIITTRDVHILKLFGEHERHEVKFMNHDDAKELLCRKAFKSDNSSSDYADLIPKVLKYAEGLPLAIKVLGSFLYSRNTTQWRATLKGLENNPNSGIMKVLQSSFEGLDLREKEIFLHVACFFDGERKDYVARILDACGLLPEIRIPLLAEKSFITIRNEEIHMHKTLQELGKEIAREGHPDEPRLWSRLWLYRDLQDAMITKLEAIKAKAIILNQKEDVSNFNQPRDEDLLKLENLKLLILDHSNFRGSPKFLCDSLCYLMWKGYPYTSFPSNFQPYNLVELNMPNSNIEHLWINIQHLPKLKRMDLSNSKNLKETPCFEMIQNLERLDFTGCINLLKVHPSIGLLTKLEFLSLQNCTSLVTLDFGNEPIRPCLMRSLRVLHLAGCTKLENTPNFYGLFVLQYLDMDQCASLSTIHESVRGLAMLKLISLRDCTNLAEIPAGIMRHVTTLDLCGCSKLDKLPLTSISMKSLVFLDLSFCNLGYLPNAFGEHLSCLERLNLQGNKIGELPSTFKSLHNLSYLNLSHCHHWLVSLDFLPTESGPSNSVGRYFETTSGSRNHRSGLYVFDVSNPTSTFKDNWFYETHTTNWILRLLKEPLHFRCGFDLVLPMDVKPYFALSFHHWFQGGSIVRINNPVMDDNCLGFLFIVTFELNNHLKQSSSSSLPHPFYLSFESEYTEERFDMLLNLESNKVDGLIYGWVIYISREHCHFVKTGAHITFKARQGLIIKQWGLRAMNKEDTKGSTMRVSVLIPSVEVLIPSENVKVKQRNTSSFEPKIQLPYNWFVSDKDEAERDEAKGKETELFNLGLLTESSQ